MDPGWRIKKHYGKGTRRLILGFPRRRASDEKLGLRRGLRIYGLELPFRGPIALVLIGAVSVVALSIFWHETETRSDLLLTLLDAPPRAERARQPEAQRARQPEAQRVDAPEMQPPSRLEAKSPRDVAPQRQRPMPQIGSPSGLAAAEPAKLVRPVRGASLVAPALPDGARPVLPAVSARGPQRTGAVAAPSRGANAQGLPLPALSSKSAAAQTAELAPRGAERIAVPRPRAAQDIVSRQSPNLRGVPLASLASCLSEGREDTLKQQVVARVPQPATCESTSGTYRFVETKNLNAFLMWIERAGDRNETDRCTELSYAIECLSNGVVQKEARKS